MTEDPVRVYPRAGAFEALLAKVYLEIWNIQDDPSQYANRVERFATVWLPTMFQEDIFKKIPDFEKKINELEIKLDQLRAASVDSDPLTIESVEQDHIPAEVAALADDVWHAVLDVLTDAGFNFPVGKPKETRKMG